MLAGAHKKFYRIQHPEIYLLLPRPQSLLLISKAHKLRLKLLISEYRKLYSSAVIGGGGSAEGKGKAKEGIGLG